MSATNISLQAVLPIVKRLAYRLKPYMAVLFFVLFAVVYGFIVLRINALSNATVDPGDVTAQVKASPSPHIDAAAIKQLQTLKDNSVNVQTLFEQGRSNPFQE